MKTITVLPTGEIQFLGDVCPVDLPLVNPIRRRVSLIQPAHNVWKRIVFLLVRRCFGDRGRGAAWSRRWRGPWRATILATGQSAVFETREECVAWELTTISENDSMAPLD